MLALLRDLLSTAHWIVRFHHESPPTVKGSVPRIFIQEAWQLLKTAGVQQSRLCGVKQGRFVKLQFDSSVPKPLQQRLRNLWTAYQGP